MAPSGPAVSLTIRLSVLDSSGLPALTLSSKFPLISSRRWNGPAAISSVCRLHYPPEDLAWPTAVLSFPKRRSLSSSAFTHTRSIHQHHLESAAKYTLSRTSLLLWLLTDSIVLRGVGGSGGREIDPSGSALYDAVCCHVVNHGCDSGNLPEDARGADANNLKNARAQ